MKRIIAAFLLVAMLAPAASAAISLTLNPPTVFGNKRIVTAELDLDSSYRNGGEALTPANLGLLTLEFVQFNCDNSGYLLQYDYSAEKVIAFAHLDSTAATVTAVRAFVDAAPDTNAVDLSGVIDIRIFAIGN